jgi:hypothetical protein
VPPAREASGARPGIPALFTAAYTAVAGLMLLRLLVGWRAAVLIVRGSAPCRGLGPDPKTPRAEVRESRELKVPVTVGVWHPVILLPAAWRSWTRETLCAVLAHERAHVERRDALVAGLARLNRSLFWFHPLAWWLERRLAAAAEEVCDAAGARAMGDPRRYARLLIGMAESVRAAGGRVSALAVGMGGGRLLRRRVDRVLDASVRGRVSPLRAGATAAACASAIALASACRPAAAPQRARGAIPASELTSLGADEVAALEAALRERPEDLESRGRLLALYTAVLLSPDATPEQRAARRAHALWVVEHRPGSPLAGSQEARLWPSESRVFWPVVTGSPDDEGYAIARKLWLSHAAEPDVSDAVLVNASRFFEMTEKPLAEEMLLRGREREPHGEWSIHLGRLYAIALVGDRLDVGDHSTLFVNLAEADGAYAASVQRALAETTDVTLLLTVAERIMMNRHHSGTYELARPFVERAAQLDPDSLPARVHLEDLRRRSRSRGPLASIRRVPLARLYEAASALPDAERFDLFPDLAYAELWRGFGAARAGDPYADEYVALALGNARRLAQDALQLAPRYGDHPRHGSAVHTARLTLALLAMREGDVDAAARELELATRVSADDGLAYASGLLAEGLLRQLLDAGAREPVIAYLEWYAGITEVARAEVSAAAAALRSGEGLELRWPSSDLWVTKQLVKEQAGNRPAGVASPS